MGPLAGIRVVDMGLWVAGPAAGGILADWGADVVKVEMLAGDPMRKLFGALSGSKVDRCPPFDLYNRGKRSIALDVNRPEGAAVVRDIVASADVFVTNMRPSFLERVGLDHDALLTSHPQLVYGLLTGYGLSGPDKDAPGFDMAAFSARSGLAHRATPPGAPTPTLPGGLGDNVSAITLVAGILAALLERGRSGRGQLVSASLLRTGIYAIGMDVSTRLGLGRIGPSPSRIKPQNPLMNSYKAADDTWFWLIGAESERHWPGIVTALGAPELAEDERFRTPRDRRRNGEALVIELDRIFARRTRPQWAELFKQHDVWWAPVNSVEDLITDPQVRACGAFLPVATSGTESTGEETIAAPIDFGASRPDSAPTPPAVGEHSDEILNEIGMADEDRARLRAAGIIG